MVEKSLRRVFIYSELYIEVITWAKKQTEIRAPNNKPLHKNFPAALDLWVRRVK